jgi:cell division protein FtsW
MIVTCGLLVLCFVPGVGLLINGERRWIDIGPLQIQPSELAKLSVVFFLSFWYSRYPDCGNDFFRGFLSPLTLVGMVMVLILFEVDIGSTAVLGFTVLVVLFVAGVHWRYLTCLVVTGIGGFIGMMCYSPDRIIRLAAFIDPEKHRSGAGFQQWISLMALGSGELTGRGLGEGRLKMLYMPFAHTDFIFPMIGEELGLLGTLLVVLAFICVVCAGMFIAFHARDRLGLIMATGICSMLAIQAFFNIGVTTSILPNTGLPLPFVSYGGSSLVISFASVGILINIYRQGRSFSREPSEWGVRNHRETPRL